MSEKRTSLELSEKMKKERGSRDKKEGLSRRDFLKVAGAVAGAVAVGTAASKIEGVSGFAKELVGRDFDQEKFLENLGDPRQYFLEVSGEDIEPGENLRESRTYESRGLEVVDTYGIIASQVRPVPWTAENGEKYTLWQADLAFPNRGEDETKWTALPVTVWADKAEGDMRRENIFFYDVAKERSFDFGDMAGREYKARPYASREDDPSRLDSDKFVDKDEYVKIRDQALKQFQPGRGMVAPIIMSINEGVEWEGEPSKLKKGEYYVYEWWKEGDQSLLEGCMEKGDSGREVIKPSQCSWKPGEVQSAGRVIDGVFVELGW